MTIFDPNIVTAFIIFGATCLFYIFWRKSRRTLDHIGGPTPLPLLGNVLQVTTGKLRYDLQKWAEEYGPLCKIKMLNTQLLIVSGYDHLHEMLVSKGDVFAGRPYFFRMEFISEGRGMTHTIPGPKYKGHKKLTMSCLKRFDENKTTQEISGDLVQDMLEKFRSANETSIDPECIIHETALKSLAFFITGSKLECSDPLFQYLKEFEHGISNAVGVASVQYIILDLCPWLLHFPLKSSKKLKHISLLRSIIWNEIQSDLNTKGKEHLAQQLTSLVKESGNRYYGKTGFSFGEYDARMGCLEIVVAGLAALTGLFHAFINILAHNPLIQDKLYSEICKVIPNNNITTKDRSLLPYTNATILELLRYVTVGPTGLPHMALEDSEILGVSIPKGTRLLCNFWALHHDREFWGDPDVFRPERFLDSEGELLPSDHPRRRHLMVFSAGIRICPGEQYAINNLVVWTATVVRQLRIIPDVDNLPSSIECTSFAENLLLSMPSYKVLFSER